MYYTYIVIDDMISCYSTYMIRTVCDLHRRVFKGFLESKVLQTKVTHLCNCFRDTLSCVRNKSGTADLLSYRYIIINNNIQNYTIHIYIYIYIYEYICVHTHFITLLHLRPAHVHDTSGPADRLAAAAAAGLARVVAVATAAAGLARVVAAAPPGG